MVRNATVRLQSVALQSRIQLFFTWRVYISLKIAYLRLFLVKSLMDNNRKLLYDPPVIEIVDVKTEGLVCASNTYNGFGEEEKW